MQTRPPMTWKELCDDKRFADLPYKFTLTNQGKIILSPVCYFQGVYASVIDHLLGEHLPQGRTNRKCAIETGGVTSEVDIAWLSLELHRRMIREKVFACPVSPEICVEVISASNTKAEMRRKGQLLFAAGAKEYWLCDAEGKMQFFAPDGKLETSRMAPEFPIQLPDE